MKRILLIIPYFGKWPLWFDAYLISVASNPTVRWLCPTDIEIPKVHPSNITFLPTTLSQLNEHVNKVVEAEVPLNPRKFCDLKPAYAEIFAEQVQGYDFWGISDMDIVWGDIREFMTEELLNKYDIISSRKENISGHFNLFRNTKHINSLYKQLPNYKDLFEVPEFKWTDEIVLSNFIKSDPAFKVLGLRVYWPSILCNQERGIDSHQEYHINKWLWEDGKMLELKNGKVINEIMYLHFINWKRTLRYCEVEYKDSPHQFYISFIGVHYSPYSGMRKMLNRFNNLFFGYYKREERRKVMTKYKKSRSKIIKLIRINGSYM